MMEILIYFISKSKMIITSSPVDLIKQLAEIKEAIMQGQTLYENYIKRVELELFHSFCFSLRKS